jgi:hypothetical protein
MHIFIMNQNLPILVFLFYNNHFSIYWYSVNGLILHPNWKDWMYKFHSGFWLGPKSKLQNRLLFHLSHKFGDEKRLMGYHQSLQDVIEDQLSLASIHYLRSHYQEAIDIYKRILLDNRYESYHIKHFMKYQSMFK